MRLKRRAGALHVGGLEVIHRTDVAGLPEDQQGHHRGAHLKAQRLVLIQEQVLAEHHQLLGDHGLQQHGGVISIVMVAAVFFEELPPLAPVIGR